MKEYLKMSSKLTSHDIAQNLEVTRKRLKENITQDDIDVIFDLFTAMYYQIDTLQHAFKEAKQNYLDLYRKHNKIPRDALIDFKKQQKRKETIMKINSEHTVIVKCPNCLTELEVERSDMHNTGDAMVCFCATCHHVIKIPVK